MSKSLFSDDLAPPTKERAGQKYRPANGTEGDMFMAAFCDNCRADTAYRNGTGDSCPIICGSLALDLDDAEYPSEIQYGPDGQPTCIKFEPEEP